MTGANATALGGGALAHWAFLPAQQTGAGKVTLNLQNRTVEYQAQTPYQQLPTGSKVVVTAVPAAESALIELRFKLLY